MLFLNNKNGLRLCLNKKKMAVIFLIYFKLTNAEGKMKLVEVKSTLNHTTAMKMMNVDHEIVKLMVELSKFQNDEIGD